MIYKAFNLFRFFFFFFFFFFGDDEASKPWLTSIGYVGNHFLLRSSSLAMTSRYLHSVSANGESVVVGLVSDFYPLRKTPPCRTMGGLCHTISRRAYVHTKYSTCRVRRSQSLIRKRHHSVIRRLLAECPPSLLCRN